MSNERPRVRFAPSPTGFLHLGGARTALFNWLLARGTGGTFILRIEDTDRERSNDESVQQILEDMAWLGMSPDEGPYFQSRRGELYQAALGRLVASGKAYRCVCTPEELTAKRESAMSEGRKPRYDGTCRALGIGEDGGGKPFVWRFRSPEAGHTVFSDAVRGEVRFANEELDDLIVVRSDGSPTYNFCVVVDDADLRISHVIRGEDHLSNTPRQIQLYVALGLLVPAFAHLPLIKGLSKRIGSAAVGTYRDEGYLPEAVVNALARMGWSHGDQEIFSPEELIEHFSLEGVGKAGGAFNSEKMAWTNAQHIHHGDAAALARAVVPNLASLGVEVSGDEPILVGAVEQLKERSKSLIDLALGAVFYFRPVAPNAKAEKILSKAGPELIGALVEALEAVGEEDWSEGTLEAKLRELAEARELGFGKVAQPIRAALTGSNVSPGVFEICAQLGRDETLARMQEAARRGA